jgi:hypothetical protein
MAVVVPANADGPNYELYLRITTLTNAITAAGNNGPLALSLTIQLANTQLALVLALLGNGAITAASVLSLCTYSTPTPTAGGTL